MMEYFKTFYAPNNAVIVLVGDIDADKAFDEFEKRFGQIPASKTLEKTKKNVLSQKGFDFKGKYGGRHIKLKGTSPNPNFMLTFKGVKIGEPSSYALDLLSSILGDGESSLLSQRLVLSKRPLLSRVGSFNYTLQDSGIFFINGELIQAGNLKYMKKRLLKDIKKSCEKDINERSLQKAKNQYLVHMVSGLETNAGVARFLGDREIYYGDYRFYEKELDNYNKVTLDQVKALCRTQLTEQNSIFLSIWKKHK